MKYEVQTWDDKIKCVMYYTVDDAIDYDDAKDHVKRMHPDQQVIAVVKRK